MEIFTAVLVPWGPTAGDRELTGVELRLKAPDIDTAEEWAVKIAGQLGLGWGSLIVDSIA